MSLENYEIYVVTPSGTRLAGPLSQPLGLEWALKLNDVGVLGLEMNAADWDDAWFDKSLLLQVWRQPRFFSSPQLIQWFWIDDWGKRDEDDVTIAWVKGYDLNTMLSWRIVIGPATTAGSEKTGAACEIMWEYVDEALLTDAGRDISDDFDFTGDDISGGETISYTASRGKVLSVLQGCANASAALLVPVRFWIRPTETGGILRITEQPWGSDRRCSRPFSPEFGTLYNPRWSYRGSDAETFAYVGGQGRGEERTVVTVDLTDGTPLGRREIWMENSQISLPSSLEDWGAGKLFELRPRLAASGELRDTELSAFGRDWGLGDWVTCEYESQVFEAEVMAITGKVTADGELIQAKVEGEVDLGIVEFGS